VSEVVDRLVGSYVEPEASLHPLANVVEGQLKDHPEVKRFLASLPEQPPVNRLHVIGLSERRATCACPFTAKDRECPSYFHSEVRFEVDLATGRCLALAG
jgi:hypothetical protein